MAERIDVAATLLAAAVREGPNGVDPRPLPTVHSEDLRVPRVSPVVRRGVCFLVDTSRSMAARQRIGLARSAIHHLLAEGYRERVEVAVIAMGGPRARVIFPWTRDVEGVDAALASLRPSGRTPLAHGLHLAAEQLAPARKRGLAPCLVVLTDGRANVPLAPGGDPLNDALAAAGSLTEADALVVDTENDFLSLGVGAELARALGAQHVRCAPEAPEDPIRPWLESRA